MLREQEPTVGNHHPFLRRTIAASALTAAALLPAACSDSPERPDTPTVVALNEALNPAEKAMQIQDALNANKVVSNVPVEIGHELEVTPAQVGVKDAVVVLQPIRLDEDEYCYFVPDHKTGAITAKILRTDAELEILNTDNTEATNPHQEKVSISKIYYEGELGGVDPTVSPKPTYKFYTIGINVPPGERSNKLGAERAGELGYYSK